MSKLEKIFSLIIKFGDSEKQIPTISKLLQGLNARLQTVLQSIREIGKESGFKHASDVLKVYDTTVKEVDTTRKQATATAKKEKEQNEAAAKVQATLLREYKNLIFTKKEIAAIAKNYIILQNSEKGSVEALTAQINILRASWNKMGAEQRNSVAGKKVTADLKAMRTELRQVTQAAGDNSRNIGNYASTMFGVVSSKLTAITGIAYTIKRVLYNIYQPFQDLEYRLSMVKAVTQATAAEFIALEHNARTLGATTEYTATEVAGLQLSYGRMGFIPEQIIEITSATLDLATATGEDLAKSADIVGTTLKGFNLEANQTKRVVDVMTQAFNKSSLKLESFYEAMKYVAPIASQANVSLEQTSAMLGVLADRGIRGSQAGTALRRIFTEMAKEGGSVTERLDQLSQSGLTLGGAMDEVGRYAMTALTVLSKSKEGVDSLTAALDNSAGSAKRAADIMRDNMKGDMDKLLSATQEKLIAIGEALAPLARGVMQFGTAFVSSLKEIAMALLAGAGIIAAYNARLAAKKALTQAVILWDKAGVIATQLNTAAITGNTAALLRNAVALRSSSLLAKALVLTKLLLTGNIKAATTAMSVFTKTLMKNPLGLMAVALASVITYFVFFRKEADAATKAQQRFNDEQERFTKLQDEKRQQIEALIRVIKDESETDEAKIRAYRQLQQLSPALTARYSQEEIATLALADSTRVLNEERDKQDYDKQKTELARLLEVYKQLSNAQGDWNKVNITDDERSRYNGQSTKNALKDVRRDIDLYKKSVDEIESIRRQAEENNQPIKIRIEAAEGNVERITTELTKLRGIRDEWIAKNGSSITMPIELRVNLANAEKALTEEQKKLEALNKKAAETPAGGKGDKGEWSLSKDKEYNRQLFDLKQQLLAGEIASEDAYQKQVLQLEVDTLTKRISLNKDSGDTLAKLRSDLLDKHIQQKKAEQKQDENFAVARKTQSEAVAQYDIQHREAEVQAMADSIDKKIRLNDLSTEKAKEATQKEYDAKIDVLTKEQRAYANNPQMIEQIEAEKIALTAHYQQKTSDVTFAGANARVKILRDATTQELQEYGKLPDKAAEAERAITDNKRLELEKRKRLAQESLVDAGAKYNRNERLADEAFGTDQSDNKRRAAKLKNEIEIRQAQAQTYMAELEAMEKNGQAETAYYQQTLANVARLKQEAENLGKGLNSDGSGGGVKGWLMRTFEITPEQIEQLKQQAWDLASQLGSAVIDAQKQASQRRLANEKKSIDAEYKIHSKLLDDKRDKGLISEKTYQKEMEKLEAQKQAKEEEADRAAFEREKKLNIVQVIMNTAISVAKAFAQFGPLIGIPFAAMALAQGAIQIGIISSQKYAQGGIIPLGDGVGVVKGRSHAQGGHQIYIDGRPVGEIEGDELIAIVNKRDTARIGALSAANSVNGRKFAQGGMIAPSGYVTHSVGAPMGYYATTTQSDNVAGGQVAEAINLLRDDIKATNERIDRLRVFLVTSDVTESQASLKKVEARQNW